MTTIAELIESVNDKGKRDYLRLVTQNLREDGERLRSIRTGTAPSTSVPQLKAIESNPDVFLERILASSRPALFSANSDPIVHQVLYQCARQVSARTPAAHLGQQGDILNILADAPDVLNLVRKAAHAACAQQEKLVDPGRGGPRRKRDTALLEAASHLLEIYEFGFGTVPQFVVCGSEIKGQAIEFLELCLTEMGLAVSRSTLRRLIESYKGSQVA